MVGRCKYKGVSGWKYYGGKGIRVEWLSFDEFKADMYESYLVHVERYGEKNTTIDRTYNEENYKKSNCNWATLIEQNRNKSNNTFLTLNGETKNLVVWAKKLGINKDTLSTRIMRGWSVKRLLTTPARKYTEFRI